MICIVFSDTHITEKRPTNRKEDNWLELCLKKLRQPLEMAMAQDCPVIIPGDILDRSSHPPEVVNGIMEVFEDYSSVQIYAIAGNHDVKSHNLSLINKSSIGHLDFLSNCQVVSSPTKIILGKISARMYPFGTSCKGGDVGDIAFIHEMVWDKEPFPGAPVSGNCENILKTYSGFSLIVAGDNHKPFTYRKGGQELLNCGSMMRRNIDQQEHKPMFYGIEKDLSIKKYFFDIEDNVFNLESRKLIERKNKAIEDAANQMRSDVVFDLDFKKNLDNFCGDNKIKDSIKDIILESINE